LLDIHPDDTVGFVYRAQTYMRLREWQKAEDDYTTAISRNFAAVRGLTECHFNRGVAREQLHKMDEAKQDFEQAIKINPNDALALAKLAEFAANENDLVKACELWKKSTALGFKDPDKYLKLYCN
jgi:Tfp pilus assembly protein PilF